MSSQQDRQVFLIKLTQKIPHLSSGKSIHSGCRFIQKQDVRLGKKEFAKRYTGLLTTGKGVRYYPAFTDLVEFGKFDRKHQFGAMEVRFRDLKKYLDYVNGIVVNPFGFALRLDGEKLDRIEKENMKLKVVK